MAELTTQMLTSSLETSTTETILDRTSEILTTPEIQTTRTLTSQQHSTYYGLATSDAPTTAVMASHYDILSPGPATSDIDGTVFMTSQEEKNTFETTSENTDSVSTGSIVITNDGSSVSNGNVETTYLTSSNNGDVMNTGTTRSVRTCIKFELKNITLSVLDMILLLCYNFIQLYMSYIKSN